MTPCTGDSHVMRENNLLSPHRRPQGDAQTHEGTIGTDNPNEMWGTDATQVFTLEDGYGWIFVALEHWNAECVGFNVCKVGDRFAALEPIAQGVQRAFGSVDGGTARGLALRMDHGCQYTSDHFQHQLRWWRIAPSFAFLQQPQTNGVAERFIRTLKEQVVYERVFRNLESLPLAPPIGSKNVTDSSGFHRFSAGIRPLPEVSHLAETPINKG